ncbi:MAG: TM2 domain-containing protein [Myxococcota bacterium]
MSEQQQSQRVLIGVLAILLGGFGVHRFLLGDVGGGIIRIVITIVTCGAGAVIGLIEGIIYLTKTDEEFEKVYVQGKKGWF